MKSKRSDQECVLQDLEGQKKNKKRIPMDAERPLMARNDIIKLLNQDERTQIDFLEKFYSLFDSEAVIYKNNPYLEIRFNADQAGRSRAQRGKYLLGGERYLSLMAEQGSGCHFRLLCTENTIDLSVKFNEFANEVIENFFHRVLFLYFLKVHFRRELTNQSILRLIKEMINSDNQVDIVLALKQKINEMYPDDDLQIKIENYFENPIIVERVSSGLGNDQESFSFSIERRKKSLKRKLTDEQNQNNQNKKALIESNSHDNQENSMDIQKHEDHHKNNSFKLYTREEAVEYLTSRINKKTEKQKKYNINILNFFLSLFQQNKHDLIIGQQHAEIRPKTLGFSDTTMYQFSLVFGVFTCFFVPMDENLDLRYSRNGKEIVMKFIFKNGENPQGIYHIIRMINFVKFAKKILKYNFNRIHKLFSLMIERTDIFDALREKIETKYPKNKKIRDQVNHYFSESNNENSLIEVDDTTNQVNTNSSSSETTLEYLEDVQLYAEELDNLLEQFPEFASTEDPKTVDGEEQQEISKIFDFSDAVLEGLQLNSQFSNKWSSVPNELESMEQVEKLFDLTFTK